MVRPEVVAYFQENLKKFKLAELKKQLAEEGIAEGDVADSLKAAQKAQAAARRKAMGRLLMALGVLAIGGGAVFTLMSRKPPPAPAPVVSSASGFVGKSGYVLRLPDGYTAIDSSDPSHARVEVVYFCKAGTDQSSLLDTGLFGQLGIVRLRVEPNPFGPGLQGLTQMTQYMTGQAQKDGEKFALKNVQISELRGIQMTFEDPDARVQTYVIGQSSLYSFYAGGDNELYEGLLNSLRETQDDAE